MPSADQLRDPGGCRSPESDIHCWDRPHSTIDPTPRPVAGTVAVHACPCGNSHGTYETHRVGAPTTHRLFGLDFVNAADVSAIAASVLDGTGRTNRDRLLVTPNVDIVVQLHTDAEPDLAQVVQRAEWILPDGAPIVWASRLARRPLQARLTGSDLFAALWPRLGERRTGVFVVAANEDVARSLRESHPEVTVLVPPMIDADDDGALDRLAHECLATAAAGDAELVILGLGYPKDVQLADRMLGSGDRRRGLTVLCLGASAEMYFGHRRRAPRWAQRCGAEWLFRLAQEPGRLWRRYLVRDLAFLPLVWRECRGEPR